MSEELNNFHDSVLNSNLSSNTSEVDGHQEGTARNNDSSTASRDQIHDHLRNLNVHKTMGPGEMHWEPMNLNLRTRVLRELADAIVKAFSMTFEKPWLSGKVPGGWKKATLYSSLERKILGSTTLSDSSLCLGRS